MQNIEDQVEAGVERAGAATLVRLPLVDARLQRGEARHAPAVERDDLSVEHGSAAYGGRERSELRVGRDVEAVARTSR
ncbi:hypothetical protein ITP53_33695 [Nonomuraea sp. K274]|uniref:Uncharacterized protein n=1 Tax=Nonomuraea cypriaca TaxID=1187855 RepID=A0A931F478_9ACTN|nr:hypothetical protein [Nonomuraea cypriaca]MBF8190583.1 hypothetical protein [Nonomuraea cypriaca]